MGSFLDLGGLVLHFSFDSIEPLIGFHFFAFVGGLRGVEPTSLLWGQSFSLLVPYFRDAFADFVGLTSP